MRALHSIVMPNAGSDETADAGAGAPAGATTTPGGSISDFIPGQKVWLRSVTIEDLAIASSGETGTDSITVKLNGTAISTPVTYAIAGVDVAAHRLTIATGRHGVQAHDLLEVIYVKGHASHAPSFSYIVWLYEGEMA